MNCTGVNCLSVNWRRALDRPLSAATASALLVLHPLLLMLPVGGLLGRLRRRRPLDLVPEQQALAARIVLVGLAAGLPLSATLQLAAERTTGAVAAELTLLTRRSRREGIAQALSRWTGPNTNSLLTRLARAAASGAPMFDAVASYLAELRLERRTKAIEKARRLPVTLMIPLGLLILPGFVLLFVGPVLLGSLIELRGSLP